MRSSLHARTLVGIAFILSLILLSILANMTGWAVGADKILTVSLGLACAIPLTNFFTEPSGKTLFHKGKRK